MVQHKQEKLENKIISRKFLSYRMLNLFVIWQLTTPWFTHLVVHQKNKDGFFIPMDDSPIISVMFYVHFGGSPKLNRNTRW